MGGIGYTENHSRTSLLCIVMILSVSKLRSSICFCTIWCT